MVEIINSMNIHLNQELDIYFVSSDNPLQDFFLHILAIYYLTEIL